jgi:hypothetical protein
MKEVRKEGRNVKTVKEVWKEHYEGQNTMNARNIMKEGICRKECEEMNMKECKGGNIKEGCEGREVKEGM